MKYKAAVFDLDGTLLNTLEDIADSVNEMLKMYSFPARSYEEIRSFVGNGARNLIRQSLPADASSELIDECLTVYITHYSNNMRNKTRPYDGVIPLLRELKEKGMKIAVCSNKGDANVKGLCAEYFGGLIDVAAGEVLGIKKKPAPDGVFKAIEDLRADPRDVVYIGDSEVDVITGRNAGIPFVGVSWGFRPREVLIAEGAEIIADTADELREFLI
jgi:phosphoglycolate phosphatase